MGAGRRPRQRRGPGRTARRTGGRSRGAGGRPRARGSRRRRRAGRTTTSPGTRPRGIRGRVAGARRNRSSCSGARPASIVKQMPRSGTQLAAPGQVAVPRRGHVGDVGRQRGPPQRLVAGGRPRRAPRGRAGVHHQRAAAGHQHLEQRARSAPSPRARPARAAGSARPTRPRAEHRVERGGIGLHQRRHGPAPAAGRRARARPRCTRWRPRRPRPAAGTRCRWSSSARSSARSMPSRSMQREAGVDVVVAGADRARRLARQVQRHRSPPMRSRRDSSRRRRRAAMYGSGQMCW